MAKTSDKFLIKSKINFEAYKKLLELDDLFVNTPDYMGFTYFWHYEYRHYLRDYRAIWIDVHDALLKANLNVSEESEKHLEIIEKYYYKEKLRLLRRRK
jgi:hypothetical protein